MSLVYVLSIDKQPLMPCTPVIARLLLKQNKARVVSTTPFVIQLLYKVDNVYIQDLTLGIDSGSKKFGSAVVDSEGNVVYTAEISNRDDVSDRMKKRAKYRRNRRYRKTRYRPARFLNRKNSTKNNRISPTVKSKVDAHIREINFVKKILPISLVIIETATFDPHALKNPEVLTNKKLYQQGVNYGFANTKAYVLTRDNYTCQNCKNKSKDKRLEVHHIIFRSNNGSDDESNLITLCKTCHDNLHAGKLKLELKGKKKGELHHATHMNSIRVQLLNRVEAEETFGFITKEHRQLAGLPKEHYFDATIVASKGVAPVFKTTQVFTKKCVPDGDYQQSKGVRSERHLTTGKIQGYRKFDKVSYLGRDYFIKGRMATGYAILMDIEGNKVNLKPIPKFTKMKRVSSRSSWIITQKTIQNF